MKTKAGNPADEIPAPEIDPLVRFGLALAHLKHLYRQGWLRVGIPEDQTESVAEHSYGVAMLAMVVRDRFFPHLDSDRLLRLALIHDIGEVHAGDITIHDGVSEGEKLDRERRSVDRLIEGLAGGERYRALWEEYEAQASPEAVLVRQLDRLEMALQALVYEHSRTLDLQQFFDSAAKVQTWPELQRLLGSITAARPAR